MFIADVAYVPDHYRAREYATIPRRNGKGQNAPVAELSPCCLLLDNGDPTLEISPWVAM